MIRKIKINEELIKIIISALFFTLSFFTTKNSILYFVLLILSYIVISYEIYIDAFKNIFHGEIFDENFLMILATIGAFYIGEYPEAVMVMLLFEIGEYLSDLAVDNSKESITNLLDLRADYVNLKIETGIKKIDVNAAKIGDIFVVKPGEKIPLDGIIINGDSYLDTSSLTGEGVPRFVTIGDNVLSGTVNLDRALEIKASALFENSAASKIIDLLENATNNKTKTEKFITRFSKIYTPIVVLCAFLLFLIPTLLGYDANTWLYRALEFLVISCPCALVISVPLGFFCGIGRSSKDGILIKSSKDLDNLSKIDTVVFDKTGTITKGNFEVIKIKSYKLGEDELLELTSKVESLSNHPIAKAIVRKYGKDIDNSNIFHFAEIGGMGIKCYLNNEEILVGTKKLLEQNNINVFDNKDVGTIIYISKNKEYLGYIVIADVIKDESYTIAHKLKNIGINRVVMLSGDDKKIVSDVCEKVKIDEYYSNLLPIDKVNILEKIKEESFTAFVGDGINDAPVIKLSDIGMAMGNLGSDVTIEAADVVLMHDNLESIVKAIKISKITKRIIKFNIMFAIVFKITILFLATFGITSIWMAVVSDVGVTLLSVLNTLRIMKKKID